MRQQHQHTRGATALAIAVLTTITALVLDPASAFGRIPPDQVDPTGVGRSGATITTGSPLWTYLVVAAVALAVGVALAVAVARLRPALPAQVA